MSLNSWLISLLWVERMRALQSNERSDSIFFLPIESSPLFRHFRNQSKNRSEWQINGTTCLSKTWGKSRVTFPWVVGAPQPQCPLSPSYLGGVPLAALIGLAFGGRGRWDISHCWSICLQWWGAWKWHKEDEGREMNSLRNLTALPLATATLNHLVNQIAKVTFYGFCGQNEDLLPAGTHVAPFLHQKVPREILK